MPFILSDTNILLRGAEPTHSMHRQALDAQAELRRLGEQPCLVMQNLVEFRTVATRPRNVNGLGMSQIEVNNEIARLKTLYPLFNGKDSCRSTGRRESKTTMPALWKQ